MNASSPDYLRWSWLALATCLAIVVATSQIHATDEPNPAWFLARAVTLPSEYTNQGRLSS